MLRLSEIYVSTQGEGPRTGELTIFVRFAGCNMRCPGWPCDTPYAIDPAIWRRDSERITPVELANRVLALHRTTGAVNVCLTGGEPFIQNETALYSLVGTIKQEELNVECFSNGSIIYPFWAIHGIDFIMDWKLKGSGEADNYREQRWSNALNLEDTDCIKFVVADGNDLLEAMAITRTLEDLDCQAALWCGAVWDKIDNIQIIDFIKEHKLPWKLNVQVHKYVWEPTKRGV